jgi:hypothetical protein
MVESICCNQNRKFVGLLEFSMTVINGQSQYDFVAYPDSTHQP